MLLKNNASSAFSAILTYRSYCTHPERDILEGLRKGQEPQRKERQPKGFPERSILRGNSYFTADRVGTDNLKFPI
jgi:hypothetical protein